MKVSSQNPMKLRLWLWVLGWAMVALLIYLAGAVLGDVMCKRETISTASPTHRVLESIYLPVEVLYESSQSFRNGFDACVSLFLANRDEGK